MDTTPESITVMSKRSALDVSPHTQEHVAALASAMADGCVTEPVHQV